MAQHGKLKLSHLEDGGFNHQRDYKNLDIVIVTTLLECGSEQNKCIGRRVICYNCTIVGQTFGNKRKLEVKIKSKVPKQKNFRVMVSEQR
ncbi:hypothetical protein RCA_01840 [Rickettsia canadensis str. CA410]|uniref:Uncharacterized protein n=1 Tax=Rickettsia canadensis str. CA410 TaxID=1105107 RepID=A0ABM5MR63_RICCA|nr:hypothetical protein RCA_01840 [Rickettsia canadensis str. CA410]